WPKLDKDGSVGHRLAVPSAGSGVRGRRRPPHCYWHGAAERKSRVAGGWPDLGADGCVVRVGAPPLPGTGAGRIGHRTPGRPRGRGDGCWRDVIGVLNPTERRFLQSTTGNIDNAKMAQGYVVQVISINRRGTSHAPTPRHARNVAHPC